LTSMWEDIARPFEVNHNYIRIASFMFRHLDHVQIPT